MGGAADFKVGGTKQDSRALWSDWAALKNSEWHILQFHLLNFYRLPCILSYRAYSDRLSTVNHTASHTGGQTPGDNEDRESRGKFYWPTSNSENLNSVELNVFIQYDMLPCDIYTKTVCGSATKTLQCT